MIPAKPKTIYSINCGNQALWDAPTTEFVTWANAQASPYSLRYIGSMVADVHRSVSLMPRHLMAMSLAFNIYD
jgi:fructose-1,6-bisphosphatase I